MNSFEIKSLSISCAGETLLLHPERALFWPDRKTLFVADVHVGKEHQFGRSGIAIPGGISEHTLQRMFALCDDAGAQRLVVLGDFMHAKPTINESWLEELSRQLAMRPTLAMEIAAGNHDKPAGRSMLDSRVVWHHSTAVDGPFVLQHEPGEDPRGYVLSGHIHPAWRLRATRRSQIRTPVFWFRSTYAVLPSFGSFTGGANITPDVKNDRIYMVTSDCVIDVSKTLNSTS